MHLKAMLTNIQDTQDEGTDDNEPIIKALNSFIGDNEEGKGQWKHQQHRRKTASTHAAGAWQYIRT